MARVAFWTDKSRRYIALAISVIISTVLLSLGPNQMVSVARIMTLTVMAPAQKGISLATQFWDVFIQNRHLRKLNTELSLENQMLREAQLQNVRLRELLGFRERRNLTSILLAEVIARDPSRQLNCIEVGCGLKMGVRENMAVVTAQGLVGKVVTVAEDAAIVQLLMDRNCPVSAVVQRSRASGILAYEGGSTLRLRNVLSRMDVAVGDSVISSGLGGTFPKGIQLGRVKQVSSHPRELFQEIEVEPFVDFNSLEEVFIILNALEMAEDERR